MSYFKLEAVQDALRLDYGAERVSVGPKPRTEVWKREARVVAVAWEHGEEILSEEELLMVAEGLSIEPTALLRAVKSRGGLWLGPAPGTSG